MSITELHKLTATEKLMIIEALWGDLINEEDSPVGQARFLCRAICNVTMSYLNTAKFCDLKCWATKSVAQPTELLIL